MDGDFVERTARRLRGESGDGGAHDHSHHSHDHHDHSGHSHGREDPTGRLFAPPERKRGRGLYPTSTFPARYAHEIQVFVEMDDDVVSNHGGFEPAVAYVNALFAAVSSVYEREVDTRISVAHVAQTNRYDGHATALEAIEHLFDEQGGDEWGYVDAGGDPVEGTEGVDLHHALVVSLFNFACLSCTLL